MFNAIIDIKRKAAPDGAAFVLPILVHAVALLETVHASARIHQLLTAGEEGVALGADFDLELALDGTALEGFTASAAHDALAVVGMDIALHLVALHSNLLGAGRLAALLLHLALQHVPNSPIIN